MKKVIYTVLIGNYDELKEPTKITPDWDYVVFTDNEELRSENWKIRLVASGDSKRLSRFYKIVNQFPDYDLSVYIDATFRIKRDLNFFTNEKTEGIWFNKHPMRDCAYEEAEIVISKSLDDKSVVESQVSKYQEEGFPPQFGLWRGGIIIRNERDLSVKKLTSNWYQETEKGSWRDQISLPYVCWKNKIIPNTIPHGLSQAYFKQSLHSAYPTSDWKFSGEGEYDPQLIYKYDTAHLIILNNGLLYPRWLSNYISMKDGTERFIELVKILNGVIVRA